jgi:hypothetical protein
LGLLADDRLECGLLADFGGLEICEILEKAAELAGVAPEGLGASADAVLEGQKTLLDAESFLVTGTIKEGLHKGTDGVPILVVERVIDHRLHLSV